MSESRNIAQRVAEALWQKNTVIRDYFLQDAISANKYYDLVTQYQAVGLDLLIHNRGASSITADIDLGGSSTETTINAGDSISWSNIVYAVVKVTTSVNVDVVLAGVRISTVFPGGVHQVV